MYFRNEKGNTLLYVLVTITLLSVFGTVLSAQALNGSEQVHKTEGFQQATDAAEMGIDHFYRDFKLKINNVDLRNNTCTKIIDNAKTIINSRTIDSNTSYKITFDIDPNKNCWFSPDEGKYKFSFLSTGYINKNGTQYSDKTITATFPIQINNLFPPRPEGFDDCGSANEPCIPTGQNTYVYDKAYFPNGLTISDKSTIIANSIYTNGDLIISGYNNTDELRIEHDLFINGGSLFHNHADAIVEGNFYLNGTFQENNHGELIIKGNATFYQDILTKPQSFICVEKTLTLSEVTKSVLGVTLLSEGQTCDSINSVGNGNGTEVTGVFAKEIRIFNSDENILINDNDLEVDYTGN